MSKTIFNMRAVHLLLQNNTKCTNMQSFLINKIPEM